MNTEKCLIDVQAPGVTGDLMESCVGSAVHSWQAAGVRGGLGVGQWS